ncbi:MAG: PA-phosphatase [Alphaproteobacteria bacterium]|nr:PA-phosphatase [Alphaproteobacteria bacterium]
MTGARRGLPLLLLIPLLMAGCGLSERRPDLRSPSFPAQPQGFLDPDQIETITGSQQPSPGPTSADVAADRQSWTREGSTPGSDRWYLAIRHVELRPALAPQHFDCALGTRLGVAETPAVIDLFTRLGRDVEAVWLRLRTARPRPIDLGRDRAACIRLPEGDSGHGWSPSGGAALATVWAEAVADLAPDRAEQTRRIGREIGLSLSICGLAWPQDVAAGERLGQAVWQAARTDPAYRDLADTARAELATARTDPLENPACAAERLALRP